MSETSRQSPASEKQAQLLTALGVLGLVPFVVPPVLGFEALAGGLDWRTAQALYGATILGFLGGVRAACAAFAQTPRLADIVLSMAPPLAGYGLAAVAIGGRGSPGGRRTDLIRGRARNSRNLPRAPAPARPATPPARQ